MNLTRILAEALKIIGSKPGRPAREYNEYSSSRHWITRDGVKIRATKRYADNRQVPRSRKGNYHKAGGHHDTAA